jgi:hypothetical protein
LAEANNPGSQLPRIFMENGDENIATIVPDRFW